MNNPLLINVTPFKGLLTESKTKPGVFEVVGIMQRAGAKNQNGRIYKREILEDQVREYIENFVKVASSDNSRSQLTLNSKMRTAASVFFKSLNFLFFIFLFFLVKNYLPMFI